MKKTLSILFALILSINCCFAFTNNEIPDEFSITERWISLTTSFDIETKTQKIGTLYRKFFSLLLTYELDDPYGNILSTARARFFSLTAHFDVYDNQNSILGSVEERFTFLPSFDIYGKNSALKLANASMNFWGTTFTIYDPETGNEMATLHRPFFRLKNNWTFTVTDRHRLMSKNIDPRLLVTVAAFQSDVEYWQRQQQQQQQNSNNHYYNASTKTLTAEPQQNKLVLAKIKKLNNGEDFKNNSDLDLKELEAVAKELELGYQNSRYNHRQKLANDAMMNDFIDYSLEVAQSSDTSSAKKKDILRLLDMRLSSNTI